MRMKCPECKSPNAIFLAAPGKGMVQCSHCKTISKAKDIYVKTNFDRIAGNEEKLAMFLSELVRSCEQCPARKECDHKNICSKTLTDWLNQESKKNEI